LVVAFVKIREAARIPFDPVEQKRRTVRQRRGDLGNASDLQIRIGTLDATKCPEAIDLIDKATEITVADTCHPDHQVEIAI
jgi:hypothetical protein